MNFKIEKKQDIVIIHVYNRFDSYNCYEIEEELDKLLKNDEKKIIFSLENVDYISSSGFRLLVATLNDVKKVKGLVKLSNLPEQIEKVFHDIKLDKIFEIYPTINEAIASF